jgi:hypothetical protein
LIDGEKIPAPRLITSLRHRPLHRASGKWRAA